MLDELERAWQRARRRPRRAGDRQHRQRAGLPDRPRRRAAQPRPRGAARAVPAHQRAELRLTAWHNQVRKPVIAAVNGVCAGGGLHFVADADIVIAAERRHLPRPARLGRSGHRLRGHRPGPQDRRSRPIMRMALVGRHERMTRRRAYQLGIAQRGRRPARAAAGRGPGAGREDRPQLARRPWPPPSGPCGGRWRLGLTDACRAGCPRAGVDVGPPRPDRGPAGLRREARARWSPPDPTSERSVTYLIDFTA